MNVNCRYCAEDLGCEPWLMAWGEPSHKRCYDKAVENVRPQIPTIAKRQAVPVIHQGRTVRMPRVRKTG